MKEEKTRILLVDDQVITRSGLRNLLEGVAGLEVVGEATNGLEAVEMATDLQPDVVLMDLKMPELNGIEATRRIHRTSPHMHILILTIFQDETSIFPALRAGAKGYLLKDAGQEEIIRAIETIAQGGAIFSPTIARQVLRYLAEPPANLPRAVFDELTAREREVLELLAQGYSNLEVATHLSLSAKTVSNHISNILTKVQVTDRAKLIVMALETGFGGRRKSS